MKRSLRNLTILLTLFSISALVFATDRVPKKRYLTDSENNIVRSNFGLCWHTGFWTPADAVEGCDGILKKAAIPLVTPAPTPAPYVDTTPDLAANASASAPLVPAANTPASAPVTPAPALIAAVVEPSSERITFEADTFFDFDKSVIKPAGKTKLNDLAFKLKGIDIEVVVATGHRYFLFAL